MKIIFPCAGLSKRYGKLGPKYLLTCPDGTIMLKKVFDGLKLKPEQAIITILAEHDKKYGIKKGLLKIFGQKIKIVVLPKKTGSVVETIAKTLEKVKIREPFLVKDSDSYFNIEKIKRPYNYLSVFNLNSAGFIQTNNKSYVVLNEQENVIDIAEKRVISNIFSVGGYYFKNPKQFLTSYRELKKGGNNGSEFYISHVIKYLISHGEVFKAVEVKKYLDWGTADDWYNWISKRKTYFINLDGIVFGKTGRYFGKTYEKAIPIRENIEKVNKLYGGDNQIFIITSRPEDYRKITEAQLKKNGVKYNKLIMECLHSKKILVNDFSLENQYPSAEAINIVSDSEQLENLI